MLRRSDMKWSVRCECDGHPYQWPSLTSTEPVLASGSLTLISTPGWQESPSPSAWAPVLEGR